MTDVSREMWKMKKKKKEKEKIKNKIQSRQWGTIAAFLIRNI